MAKRMLIDATHPEETRVVVVVGDRLDEFDFESSRKKQLKGNIYLAKVTRVEPSLQACFIEYGGGRHGFLAFNEIHPDYYRLPVADRQRLIAQQAAEIGDDVDHPSPRDSDSQRPNHDEPPHAGPSDGETRESAKENAGNGAAPESGFPEWPNADGPADFDVAIPPFGGDSAPPSSPPTDEASASSPDDSNPSLDKSNAAQPAPTHTGEQADSSDTQTAQRGPDGSVESLGGDEADEMRRRRGRPIRSYKIQEVIKRRQVLLVQVVKEERGTKGAALTTYLSLAGRYCVLMPNTGRGGGISRRITNATDRKRLKSIIEDLDLPEGMAVILRTAGMERSKVEIKRDFEYLLRLWDEVRELTLRSTAPTLTYEEGSLIKRAIRDLYSRDIDEVVVEGEEGYRTAKAFMKMLMPSHAARVKLYRDPTPLFHHNQIENQLDEIHNPTIRLPAGGSIVISQTEALVAIDVNSGRATRERHIEETATRTNLEAADEIARQLRLRDLAGLIVIDFIDMEDSRNQHSVERRLKEAMKSDRARIQIGCISAFGLLELSRQRLRPSLLEVSSERCPTCAGTGLVRSTASTALHLLRAIEEEGLRQRASEIVVSVSTNVAMYVLNQKRAALAEIEARYQLHVILARDDNLIPPALSIERTKPRIASREELAFVPQMGEGTNVMRIEHETAEPDIAEEPSEAFAEERQPPPSPAEDRGAPRSEEGGPRRRRRRRRGRRGDEERTSPMAAGGVGEPRPAAAFAEAVEAEPGPAAENNEESQEAGSPAPGATAEGDAASRRRRRRGRRGGRRRQHREDGVNVLTPEESRPHDAPSLDESPQAHIHAAGEEPTPPSTPADDDLAAMRPAGDHATAPERPEFDPGPATYRFAPQERAERAPRIESTVFEMTPPEPIHNPAPGNGALADLPVPPPEERPKQPARRGWWRRGDA